VTVDRIATRRTGIASRVAVRLLIVGPETKGSQPATTVIRSGGDFSPIPQGLFPFGGRSSEQSEIAMIYVEEQAAASGCPFVPAVLKVRATRIEMRPSGFA
jgi:hypothetical protein